MKRAALTIISIIIFISSTPIVSYADNEVYDMIQNVLDWQESNVDLSAHIGENYCDWLIFGECRICGDEYNMYKDAVNDYYQNNKDSLSLPDVERLAIVYAACGGSVDENGMLDDVMGALQKSELHTKIVNQLIFALLTADSGRYDIDERDEIISEILSRQIECGALYMVDKNVPETDLTAMAVTSLAPYIDEKPEVKAAVERMIDYLSGTITEDGTAKNWGKPSCETTAQVITALCTVGIDPVNDTRFVKNGHSLIDGLKTYVQPDGSFAHNDESLGGDAYATAQALYSLVAYVRYKNGCQSLYDMRSESKNIAAHEIITAQKENLAALTADNAVESTKASGRNRVKSSVEVVVLAALAVGAGGTIWWNHKVLKKHAESDS